MAVRRREEEGAGRKRADERLGTLLPYLSPRAASWVRILRTTISVTVPCGAETVRIMRIVRRVTVGHATINPWDTEPAGRETQAHSSNWLS